MNNNMSLCQSSSWISQFQSSNKTNQIISAVGSVAPSNQADIISQNVYSSIQSGVLYQMNHSDLSKNLNITREMEKFLKISKSKYRWALIKL